MLNSTSKPFCLPSYTVVVTLLQLQKAVSIILGVSDEHRLSVSSGVISCLVQPMQKLVRLHPMQAYAKPPRA